SLREGTAQILSLHLYYENYMFLVRHHVAVLSKLLDQGEPVELTEYVQHQGRSLPARKLEYLFAIKVGGILRTDDPFVVNSVQHTNATNGIPAAWQRSCHL